MRISKLHLENYNRFGEASLDFDKCSALTMLAGKLDSAGASSNGSGKSSVLDAICWVTFGQELPRRGTGADKRTAASMIRDGTDHVRVDIEYTHKDKTILRISRRRRLSGSVELYIDGKRSATVQGGQSQIDRRLGMTFELFTRTVVFGGELSSFCRASPTERTRLLEELLGIEHYLEAADRARVKATEVEGQIAEIEGRREVREQAFKGVQRDFKSAVWSWADALVEYEEETVNNADSVAEVVWEWETLQARLDKVLRKAGKNSTTYEKDLLDWEGLRASLSTKVANARQPLRDADRMLESAEAELRVLKGRIDEIEGGKHADICPTCRQVWPQDNRTPDTSSMHAEVRSLKKTVAIRRETRDEAMRLLEEHEGVFHSHEKLKPTPPEQSKKIRRLHEKIANAEAEINALLSMDDRRDDARARVEYERMMEARKRLAFFRDQGDTDTTELKRLRREHSLFRYWQRGLGRDGIPAAILASVAPSLNSTARRFVNALTDHAYTVSFSVEESSAGKSALTINARNIEGGRNYADLSRGESVRVDLCALFAIRELMKQRSGVEFEQVFLDELVDGLDSEGSEKMIRLLRSKKLAPQVFYISHNDMLREAADSVVTVEKIAGVARITQRGVA